MPPSPEDPSLPSPEPVDQLRHDLKTPLTTIKGHSDLLARAVRRSPSLTEAERQAMLARLAAVSAAVGEMVAVIEAMRGVQRHHPDDAPDSNS
jgi:signal transduction histidine kinase